MLNFIRLHAVQYGARHGGAIVGRFVNDDLKRLGHTNTSVLVACRGHEIGSGGRIEGAGRAGRMFLQRGNERGYLGGPAIEVCPVGLGCHCESPLG
ncbi:MAG: hypothetical protein JNM98_18540 [Rhodocyclaceae bacterium]|nr:hypothetical protein [Rhodocyclaceae bacterium]